MRIKISTLLKILAFILIFVFFAVLYLGWKSPVHQSQDLLVANFFILGLLFAVPILTPLIVVYLIYLSRDQLKRYDKAFLNNRVLSLDFLIADMKRGLAFVKPEDQALKDLIGQIDKLNQARVEVLNTLQALDTANRMEMISIDRSLSVCEKELDDLSAEYIKLVVPALQKKMIDLNDPIMLEQLNEIHVVPQNAPEVVLLVNGFAKRLEDNLRERERGFANLR